jgi:hypothetical protein
MYENELLSAFTGSEVIGNISLREQLGWPDCRYWPIRDRLIDEGKLRTGKGRGGSVRRILSSRELDDLAGSPVEVVNALQMQLRHPSPEVDLYEPIAEGLKDHWAKVQRFQEFDLEITGLQGSKDTGGKWSRPDITVAAQRSFKYIQQKCFDVITFEVKRIECADVTAVYEALSHRGAATRAYVILFAPPTLMPMYDHTVQEIAEVAEKQDIGLIVISEISDHNSWDEKVEAVRHEPDPVKLNTFLTQQIGPDLQDKILLWLK